MTTSTTRRVYRSTRNRQIGGVCGGIAEHFNWDPSLVRLGVALSTLLPGPQIVAYLIAWLVLPSDVEIGLYSLSPMPAPPSGENLFDANAVAADDDDLIGS